MCNIYNKVIKPTILYGSELWNDLKTTDVDQINRTQHYIVKSIQQFPKLTRSDMSESMLGLNRLSSQVEDRKLRFVHKISTLNTNSITRQIFTRRLLTYIKDPTTMKGFIPDMYQITEKYLMTDILYCFTENAETLSKYAWKRRVRHEIAEREQRLWEQRINSDFDFTLFRRIHTSISPAVVWSFLKREKNNSLSIVISTIWVQKAVRSNAVCKFCKNVYVNKYVHILSECLNFKQARETLINDISRTFGRENAMHLTRLGKVDFACALLGARQENISIEQNYDFYKCVFTFVRTTVSEYDLQQVIVDI